jgi:polyisoprenyl-teichoic acid--peptidoglycan teichoic acid transferase
MRRVIILVLVATVLIGGLWAANTFLFSDLTPRTILLMGTDEGKTRTDVLVVVHVDPKQNRVSLISIPRDTYAEIDCKGIDVCVSPDKIAHAHAYGGLEKGPLLTKKAVEKLLSLPIAHYARVDFDGFEKVVDLLGGVDIVIEQNMDYEDPYANPPLKIHFKASPDPQRLDGEDALKYVRFRDDGQGDIGRILRTKKFFFALVESVRNNGSVSKMPSLVNTGLAYVKTDLDAQSLVSLGRMAPRIDLQTIEVDVLPGTPVESPLWVWMPDPAKTKELVDRLIRDPKPESD